MELILLGIIWSLGWGVCCGVAHYFDKTPHFSEWLLVWMMFGWLWPILLLPVISGFLVYRWLNKTFN